MKRIILILSVVLFFFSCKDNEGEIVYYDTCIYGNITDYTTGKPIVGVVLDVEYNDEYQGMSFGGSSTERVTVYAASTTDMNGYYSIPIAKKVGAGANSYIDFENIVIKPRNTNSAYNFSQGFFSINRPVDTSSTLFYEKDRRSDITAKARNDYGFVKLYYDKKDTVRYTSYMPGSFHYPYFNEMITLDTIEEQDFNYYIIKAPLLINQQINVFKNSYRGETFFLHYTLINRMDTTTISIL
ncbi:MAG: hypothetical protein WC135_03795 [Bacteroidales bacterium]